MQHQGKQSLKSRGISSWLLGSFHLQAVSWIDCRRNWKKIHSIWDKRYQREWMFEWSSTFIRKGYPHLKLVWVTLWMKWISSRSTMTTPSECWTCMPVLSAAYYGLQSRQGHQQHPLSNSSLKDYSEWTLQPWCGLRPGISRRSLTFYIPWVNQQSWTTSRLNLKMMMILALATVRRPSDLNLLRITPKTMQVAADSIPSSPCLVQRIPSKIIHMDLQ